MLLPAEMASFAIDPSTNEPVVILKTMISDRTIAIPVGPSEAAAIAVHSLDLESLQPLTIDLAGMIMEQLGGKLERIVICDYLDQAFLARLHIMVEKSLYIVDCRPSDALALAMRCGAPVFIDEAVFDKIVSGEGATEADKLRETIAGTNTLALGSYFLEP